MDIRQNKSKADYQEKEMWKEGINMDDLMDIFEDNYTFDINKTVDDKND